MLVHWTFMWSILFRTFVCVKSLPEFHFTLRVKFHVNLVQLSIYKFWRLNSKKSRLSKNLCLYLREFYMYYNSAFFLLIYVTLCRLNLHQLLDSLFSAFMSTNNKSTIFCSIFIYLPIFLSAYAYLPIYQSTNLPNFCVILFCAILRSIFSLKGWLKV